MRKLALCAVLQFGALVGLPMPPEEVTRLMQSLSRPVAVRTSPDESDDGEDLPERPDGSAKGGEPC
jgi:hypothetical protein